MARIIAARQLHGGTEGFEGGTGDPGPAIPPRVRTILSRSDLRRTQQILQHRDLEIAFIQYLFRVFGFAWVIGCVATRYYLREIVCCRKRKGLYAKSTGAYRLDLCLTDSTR